MIVTSKYANMRELKKTSSIAIAGGFFEGASQSDESSHFSQIEPQDAMMTMTRRSRSSGSSSNSSGSIVSDDAASAAKFNNVANFAAIKAARAEVSCLHATHKIETQSLRHEIKHWKALAMSKDQVFDKAIGSLKKELE